MRTIVVTVLVVALVITGVLVLGSEEGPPGLASLPPESTAAEDQPSEPASASKMPETKPALQRDSDQGEPPTAVSSFQPALTLAGHIEQRIRDLSWDDPNRRKTRVFSSGDDIGIVLSSTVYNPEQKTLSEADSDRLRKLIESNSARKEELLLAEGRAGKDALLRAVRSGRVESIIDPTPTSLDPADLHRIEQERKATQAETLERLSGWLGRPLEDWAYTIMTTQEPDGVFRTNFIYYTRASEPDVFEARRKLKTHRSSTRASYRRFFKEL